MKRGVLVIDEARDQIEAEIRLVDWEPLFLAMDPRHRKVLLFPHGNTDPYTTSPAVVFEPLANRTMGPEDARPLERRARLGRQTVRETIWEIDWDTLALEGTRQAVSPGPIGQLGYSEKHETLYAAPGYPSLFLYAAARPLLAFTRLPIGGLLNFAQSAGLGVGMAVDDDHDRLFVSYALEGAIYVFDTKTHAYAGKLAVAPGVRDLAFDRERGRLLAGGYLDGHVYAIDPGSGTVVDKVFVGRKIRHIFLDMKTRSLLATSANGLLEVRLDGSGNGS